MSWTTNSPNSRIFQQSILNPMLQKVSPGSITVGTTYSDLVATDTVNVALFNNSITPDATAVMASIGFNTGTWTTGNEVIDTGGSNWASGGRALGTKSFTLDTGSHSACFTAANLSGAGNVTIANAFGCLVYDNSITAGTVAKQGLCYNYFGGGQSVTAGTFTIQWATPSGAGVTAVFNVSV